MRRVGRSDRIGPDRPIRWSARDERSNDLRSRRGRGVESSGPEERREEQRGGGARDVCESRVKDHRVSGRRAAQRAPRVTRHRRTRTRVGGRHQSAATTSRPLPSAAAAAFASRPAAAAAAASAEFTHLPRATSSSGCTFQRVCLCSAVPSRPVATPQLLLTLHFLLTITPTRVRLSQVTIHTVHI